MRMKVTLPEAKEKKELVRSIDDALRSICDVRNRHAIEWLITSWWLQGARSFRDLNYRTGTMAVAYETAAGNIPFRYEDALMKSQTELGRLGQLDLRPLVQRRPSGLEAARRASMMQVVFDWALDKKDVAQSEKLAQKYMVNYGPFAVMPLVQEWPDGTKIYGLDVIAPWEFGALPAVPDSPEIAGGILRDRWVSEKWLLEQRSLRVPRFAGGKEERRRQMRARPMRHGTTPHQKNSPVDPYDGSILSEHTFADQRYPDPSGKPHAGESYFVQLIEVWLAGPEDTLSRHIVKAGDVILSDETFGDEQWKELNPSVPLPPPFPIGIGEYYPAIGLYGRGFSAPQVYVNKEIESLLSALSTNIKDWDAMGITFISTDMGVSERELASKTRPKIIRVSPSGLQQDLMVKQMRPANSGALPAQIAQLFLGLADRQSGQGEMFQGGAPGRVDSQVGLGFLQQMGNIPLEVPAKSMAAAFSQAYKSLAYTLKENLTKADEILLSSVDDSAAGVVVDPQTLEVTLGENGLPWPHQVTIGVKTSQPVPEEQRKIELFGLLQQGLIGQTEFWIAVVQGRLPVEGLPKSIEAAVEKATLNNILVFADGETPGEARFNPGADNAEVFLLILEAFMQRVIFDLSSNEVQDAFREYKNVILNLVPKEFPAPLGNLEDEAAAAMQALGVQQAQPAQ